MDERLRQVFLKVLGEIAPEADLAKLKPDLELRDQIDIDSMDFLNVAIGLHRELGISIPEADYPHLTTLEGAVAYLGSNVKA